MKSNGISIMLDIYTQQKSLEDTDLQANVY